LLSKDKVKMLTPDRHRPSNGTCTALASIFSLIFVYASCCIHPCFGQDPINNTVISKPPQFYFLVVGKGKVTDPTAQQQRGIDAVEKVLQAAKIAKPDAAFDSLAENVMTVAQYRSGQRSEKVTGAIFRARMKSLQESVGPNDTVVIYTHSHGLRNGFEAEQPWGGIVLDLPVRQPKHNGATLWNEYADLILDIPAKNVIVLTMSCFSGGFIDQLNSPTFVDRWSKRSEEEKRNFIVLTSQNEKLTSEPIVKNRELVNPFTLAVASALRGDADGFRRENTKITRPENRDNKISVGEWIDYILHTTEHTVSEAPRRPNSAKPKTVGSFDREEILFQYQSNPQE
jgi:hypothetical protein